MRNKWTWTNTLSYSNACFCVWPTFNVCSLGMFFAVACFCQFHALLQITFFPIITVNFCMCLCMCFCVCMSKCVVAVSSQHFFLSLSLSNAKPNVWKKLKLQRILRWNVILWICMYFPVFRWFQFIVLLLCFLRLWFMHKIYTIPRIWTWNWQNRHYRF